MTQTKTAHEKQSGYSKSCIVLTVPLRVRINNILIQYLFCQIKAVKVDYQILEMKI